jgi:hypothetical protein
MAAPHVSGVAALVLSQAPSLSAPELRSRLTAYAVGLPTRYGAGLVNAYNSVTGRHGPPTQVYARLYAAHTGASAQTVAADAAGNFRFSGVEDGTYLVFAGTDEGGDQAVGTPGRLWGAYGGTATPLQVSVLGTAPHPIAFPIYYPAGASGNHTTATATTLVIGGYVQGQIVDAHTIDTYRVTIPTAAPYTFETSGWVAACGIALEGATSIGLFDANGKLLTFTGYIDAPHFNFCSRLTLNLNPGTYYVGVAGFGHRYRLAARAGP